MLETLNWYVSTHTYVVSDNIPFRTKALLILLMSAFFGKNSTFTQSNSVVVPSVLVTFLVLSSVLVT